MSKVYTNLSDLPHPVIGKCSGMLPNHMQCWRAGDVQVVETTITPAADDKPETTRVTLTQLCRSHALQAQEQNNKVVAIKK